MKKNRPYFSSDRYWNKLVHKFYKINNKVTELLSKSSSSKTEVNILLDRLKKMYKKLTQLQIKAGVKIAGSALALMLATTNLSAQNYTSLGNLQYSTKISVPLLNPSVIDFDNDGNLDLFIGSDNEYIQHFSINNNHFNLLDSATFSGSPLNAHRMFIDLQDADNDGDIDLQIAAMGKLYTFNDSAGIFNSYSLVYADTLPLSTNFFSLFDFFDIDNDGNNELFIGDVNGYITYYEYDSLNHFQAGDTLILANGDTLDVGYISAPTIGDIDNDDTIDLLVGNYDGFICKYECDTLGKFHANGVVMSNGDTLRVDYLAFPELADMDKDGDLDLLVGYYDTIPDACQLNYYKNDGNGNFTFDKIIIYKTGNINEGSFSALEFFDIDNDNDNDLLYGTSNDNHILIFDNYHGEYIYKDTLRMANDTVISLPQDKPSIEFADLDKDNDLDMFVGNDNGNILYFSNDGNNKFTAEGNLQADGSDISNTPSTLAFADLDNDGNLDLYVGGLDYIFVYKNLGNGVFASEDTLKIDSNIVSFYLPAPQFSDYDNDGDLDLFVGTYYGNIDYYLNDGNGNLSAGGTILTNTDTLFAGFYPQPEFSNTSNKCYPDLFVGNSSGTIAHFTYSDLTAPTPDTTILPIISAECSVTLASPTASDNCDSIVIGTTTDTTTYSQQGNYVVTWKYEDNAGNTTYQQQFIVINDVTDPTISCIGDTTVMADTSNIFTITGTSFDAVNFTDNCEVDTVYNTTNLSNSLNGETFDVGSHYITWVVKDEAGNSNFCSMNLIVNEFVGIKELANIGVNVYPNPTAGILNIQKAQGFDIEIIDINGKVVKSFANIDNDNFTIDMTNERKGMYILKIHNDNKIKNIKIVVE